MIDIKKPEFIKQAAVKQGFGVLGETGLFILVFIAASMIPSVVLGIGSIIAALNDPAILEAAQSGNPAEIIEAAANLTANMTDWMALLSLFSNAAMILVAMLYCKLLEKRGAYTLGFTKKGAAKQYIIGLGLGFLFFSIGYFICVITGSVKINGFSSGINIFMLIAYFLGYLIQGMSEEVLCRGYLMISISRKNSLMAGVIVNSIMFMLLHAANPGVGVLAFINLFLYGVFASLLMINFENIWIAGAFHSIWNFVQGNFYGISVSGLSSQTTVLESVANEDMALVNGGAFGLEGGLAVTIVLTAGIVLLGLSLKKKGGFISGDSQKMESSNI